jgi:hypothetical protein
LLTFRLIIITAAPVFENESLATFPEDQEWGNAICQTQRISRPLLSHYLVYFSDDLTEMSGFFILHRMPGLDDRLLFFFFF